MIWLSAALDFKETKKNEKKYKLTWVNCQVKQKCGNLSDSYFSMELVESC